MRHTDVLQLAAAVLRALMTSTVLLVLACSADPAGPVPERPAADVSEPGTPRPPRDVRDRARAEQTLPATAYYGVVDDPGRLVARPVRVATPGAGGNPVLAALERSAVATDPRLVALVPPADRRPGPCPS